MSRNESDYVIVGAGAAGCVIASRLTEDPCASVTLLEAGGPDSSIFLKIPGLSFLVMLDDRYNWNFDTEPDPGFKDRPLRILAGKVVGGSSSINGLLYTRGHSNEYDFWRQMGCVGWSSNDVLPYFKKAESSARGANQWHGAGGPLKVRRGEAKLPIVGAFLEAVRRAGFPLVDDFNTDVIEGFGLFDLNVSPQGRRVSTAMGYLAPARKRPNLSLETNVQARRVIIEKGRAKGVEVSRNGVKESFWARREVIVCAGAIKSPQLLMLSGIGPASDLFKHGLEVIADSPEVGRNYQNHVQYSLQYKCSQPVTSYKYVSPGQGVKACLEYLFTGRGVLTESPFGIGGFFRSQPDLALPDVQVVMSTALVLDPGNDKGSSGKAGYRSLLPNAHGFSLIIMPGTPHSRGAIRLRSADPLEKPMIFPNHFSDPRDMPIMLAGAKRMRAVMHDPSISELIERELTPGPSIGDDDLEDDIRKNGGSVFHQCGTCAMGDSPQSVVDAELRVRGVEGLRVADASVIPVLPNATPHAVTIMIGEKAADMIRGVRAAA